MNKNYDADGFYVLHPIKTTNGSMKLLEIEPMKLNMIGKGNASRAYAYVSTQYEVPYAPKTWQRKVWDYTGFTIDWKVKSPFRKIKRESKKVRHIKRFAIMLKVRAYSEDRSWKKKPTIDQLTPNTKKYGIYSVADDPAELQLILNNVYTMVHDNAYRYMNTARKSGYAGIDYICKCLITYDDKSFDAINGDPRNVYNLLGLEWGELKGFEMNG